MKKLDHVERILIMEALNFPEVDYLWKERVKSAFSFPKLNKWYISKRDEKWLIYLKEYKDVKNYGFNLAGNWSKSLGVAFIHEFEEAPYGLVRAKLIEEVKRRKILPTLGNVMFSYDHIKNTLSAGSFTLFKDGEWADEISVISKEEAEKQLNKIIL